MRRPPSKRVTGWTGFGLWAVAGALVASPWLIGSIVWEPWVVFLLTWPLAVAALVLCVRTTRVRPEIMGFLAGVACLLLLIALDNRRPEEGVRFDLPDGTTLLLDQELPPEGGPIGIGFSYDSRPFLQDDPCFECVDPVPIAFAGLGLGGAAAAGYAVLLRRGRRRPGS